MVLVFGLSIALLAILSVRAVGPDTRSNPVHGFMFFNTIMAVGILTLLETRNEADLVHAWLLMLTSIGFLLGGYISLGNPGRLNQSARQFFSTRPSYSLSAASTVAIWIIIGCSLLVSAWYFTQVGYILFLDALSNLITGQETSDFATRRLAAYSNREDYRAAGYVNQFKNVLLPVCVGIIIASRVNRNQPVSATLILLVPVSFVLILGTGQKGAFVQISIAFIFIYGLLRHRKKIPASVYVALTLAFAAYIVATILQGRANLDSSVAALTDIFDRILHRVLGSNQTSALVGFRYIFEQPIAWGEDWLDGFLGILPGYSGSRLANIVYSILFVTDRGTAPPSLWGSAAYNFGVPGAFAFSVILGLFCGTWYRRFLNGPRDIVRCFCYGYIFAHLSMWIASGPAQLINNGVVAIAIFRGILRVTEGKTETRKGSSIRRLKTE